MLRETNDDLDISHGFGQPIFEWWDGIYDKVFIAYHPFMKVPGYHPDTAAYGSCLGDEVQHAPDDFETTMKCSAQLISWAEVNAAIGGYAFPDFAFTLWVTVAGAGQRPEINKSVQEKLLSFSQSQGVYLPVEDSISVLLEKNIARLYSKLGVEHVTVGSPFNTQTTEVSVASFAGSVPLWDTAKTRQNHIYDRNRLIHVCAGIDDSFSYIALKKSVAEQVKPETLFEGFYADRDTRFDWLNQLIEKHNRA